VNQQRFLFIHQNFPAQFVHLAAALVAQGHEVTALCIKGRELPGVRLRRYAVQAPAVLSAVAAVRDIETKVVRGLACAQAMQQLQDEGLMPDVVMAHPGWGEALFCKDVWPQARLVMLAEFFYAADGADFNFDPEFQKPSLTERARLRMKNSVHLHALQVADSVYAPTEWQRQQLPAAYRAGVQVVFDGIDTAVAAPDPQARVHLARDGLSLKPGDEVLTFVNRNLEPYRGFHVFMRALPQILRERPNAHCVIVGGDGVSYGTQPAGGGTWRQKMLAELGAQLPMERVHFVGTLAYEDYLRVLQVSRCHVYLTYPFVLSWSCLEAMSAGCVVLASRTGPTAEAITHGHDGLLCDFFDVQALAQQAVAVLGRPEAHAHLGRQARQTVLARYDLQRVCLPALLALATRPAAR
jgi:glycosyltransferase involved in cell wall biosynthesis